MVSHVGRCTEEALPKECLSEGLAKISQDLLNQSCRLCPGARDSRVAADGHLQGETESTFEFGPGVCLDISQTGAEAMADLALQAISARQRCPLIFWTGYLITMQYAIGTRPSDISSHLLSLATVSSFSAGDSFDLHPFPFWSESRSLRDQILFHVNFMTGSGLICDDVGKTGSARGRYILRAAQDRMETHCSVRLSDAQLVKRCRQKRRSQSSKAMRGWEIGHGVVRPFPTPRQPEELLKQIQCPTEAQEAEFFASWPEDWRQRSETALQKYANRSSGRRQVLGSGCEEPSSEWREDLRPLHKCVLVVVLERLQLAPGSLVLDWGTGCGHKLTWAAQLYDIFGVGLDLVEGNVKWAREHSMGLFCQVDGRYVDWLPESTFDAVISYAALCHLHPEDQCAVVRKLVGKVVPGGQLWFGWNSPMIGDMEGVVEKPEFYSDEFWNTCFSQAKWNETIQWESVLESHLFPDDITNHESYLFWWPAYSLFIKRLHAPTCAIMRKLML